MPAGSVSSQRRQRMPMSSNRASLIDMRPKDPVCGMAVDPSTAKYKFEQSGTNYYFCCERCLEKFKAEPDKFPSRSSINSPGFVPLDVAGRQAIPAEPEGKTKEVSTGNYVCPMCPEVRETRPGSCPSCGMALEPQTPAVARVEYTCPMHPEIVRPQPGSCPICGMTLEP